MLRSLRDLEKFTLRAEDGEIGNIVDFIVDDFNWEVRYMVVNIGDRNVVISSQTIGIPNLENQFLPAQVSRALITNSPEIDLDEPLTRKRELELSDYYSWPRYWESDDIPNTLPGDLTAIPLIEMELEKEPLIPETGAAGEEEFHLRRAGELYGYSIKARNGGAGKLVDFIAQDENWDLHYLVVNTGGILPGKNVLMSPQWVQNVSLDRSEILVDLDKDTIHNSPELTSAAGVSPEFWVNIDKYYNRD